jgi:anti-sigma factor RsiW
MTDIHEAVGSYAVDALDWADLVEFEAHLASCTACQDDIPRIRETAAELSLLTSAAPPPSLRHIVLAAIRTTPQVRAVHGTVRSAPPVTTIGTRPAVELRPAGRASGPRRAVNFQPSEVTADGDLWPPQRGTHGVLRRIPSTADQRNDRR